MVVTVRDGKTKEKYRKKNVGRNNSFPLLKLFSVSFSVPMHSFIRSMLWGSLLFCITSRTAGAAALNSWLSWLWSRELPSPLLSESSFRESPKSFYFFRGRFSTKPLTTPLLFGISHQTCTVLWSSGLSVLITNSPVSWTTPQGELRHRKKI